MLSNRHFSRYTVIVNYEFTISGLTVFSSFDSIFTCSFAPSTLRQLLNLHPFLPYKSGYCSSSIEVIHVCDVPSDVPDLKYGSVREINMQLVRGLVWDLSVQLLGYQYEKELNEKVKCIGV